MACADTGKPAAEPVARVSFGGWPNCASCKVGYPPDLQEETTKTVLAQAELLSAMWAEAEA